MPKDWLFTHLCHQQNAGERAPQVWMWVLRIPKKEVAINPIKPRDELAMLAFR
jgi:hypothetical protein